MHDKPLTGDLVGAMHDQFRRTFGALTEAERERVEYTRRADRSLTFDDWRKARAARGNREGQNHD